MATQPVAPPPARLEFTQEQINEIKAGPAAVNAALAEQAKQAVELEKTIQAAEAKSLRENLGVDLPFDPKVFITTGAVLRKGLEIMPNVYADMKTLTAKDRMVAEAIVREVTGPVQLTGAYFQAIEVAVLAVAILRINEASFPIPAFGDISETGKFRYQQKVDLYKTLMEADMDYIQSLSVVYKNLKLLEDPSEETLKKS